jgi:hypothetical protein
LSKTTSTRRWPPYSKQLPFLHSVTARAGLAFSAAARSTPMGVSVSHGSKHATAELREATNVRDAILFQHTDGNFAWVGAPPKITNYLTQLWNNEQITPDELSLQIPDQAARNEIIRQFAEAYHVAHRSDLNGLSLNFNKQDISDTLDRYVSDLLLTKIDKGSSAAIRIGKFRTPSLEVVARYECQSFADRGWLR